MGLFDQFPYTNFHELNLDWLLRLIKELDNTVNNFIALNTIKYANPIQWNITTQYEANTVVVDGLSGTAYISVKPVPAGVSLTDTDYWTVIFTLDITTANNNITLRDDGFNVIATFTSNAGDWLLWNGILYKVIQNIALNEAYVVGYNITRYTVELFISDYILNLKNIIGSLTDLTTTDKDSIVDAINELVTTVGSLADLTTTDKDSIVDAINELVTITNNAKLFVTPEMYGAAGDGITDDTQAIIDCLSNNDFIFMPQKYLITSPIVIPRDNITIIGNQLICNNCDGIKLHRKWNCNINIRIITTTSNNTKAISITAAGDEGGTTICAYNNIEVGYISGFEYGLYMYAANNGGVQYNTFKFEFITECTNGIYGMGSTAWIAANRFYGGRIGVNVTNGIKFENDGNTNNTYDDNEFIEVGLEGITGRAIELHSGHYNKFNIRIAEAFTGTYEFYLDHSYLNEFTGEIVVALSQIYDTGLRNPTAPSIGFNHIKGILVTDTPNGNWLCTEIYSCNRTFCLIDRMNNNVNMTVDKSGAGYDFTSAGSVVYDGMTISIGAYDYTLPYFFGSDICKKLQFRTPANTPPNQLYYHTGTQLTCNEYGMFYAERCGIGVSYTKMDSYSYL